MANFGKIPFKGLEVEETIDIRKQLGNFLFYSSTDLKGSELGRKIYFSAGEVDLHEEDKKIILAALERAFPSYVVRQAIIESIQ